MNRRVVLVHGTWGRRSRWTKPGSALIEALHAADPSVDIERFEWSGRNRHRDRMDAAEDLREMVASGGGGCTIVAHSHGGNVAAMALRDAADGLGVSRVVTVGTPFISAARYSTDASAHARSVRLGHAERWQLRSPLTWVRLAAALAVAATGAILLAGLGSAAVEANYPFSEPPEPSEPDGLVPLTGWPATVAEVAARDDVLAIVGVTLAGVGLLGVIATGFATRMSDRELDTVSGEPFDHPAFVVIATERDEASVGLRALQLLGRLAGTASRWLDRAYNGQGANDGFAGLIVSLVLVFGLPGSLWFLVSVDGALEDFADVIVVVAITFLGSPGDEILAALGMGLAGGGVVAVVFMLLIQLNTLAIGVDGYTAALRARFSISRQPAWEHRLREVALERHRLGLRHSRLLDDPSAVAAIVAAVTVEPS